MEEDGSKCVCRGGSGKLFYDFPKATFKEFFYDFKKCTECFKKDFISENRNHKDYLTNVAGVLFVLKQKNMLIPYYV